MIKYKAFTNPELFVVIPGETEVDPEVAKQMHKLLHDTFWSRENYTTRFNRFILKAGELLLDAKMKLNY